MALMESSLVPVARRAPVQPTSRCDADRSVVWLSGDHDISTVRALSDTLARAIAFDDAVLVVDLSEVTFIGAETIGMLVRARQFLGLQSRTLELRSPSPRAKGILDLCHIALVADDAPTAIVGTNGASAAGRYLVPPTPSAVELSVVHTTVGGGATRGSEFRAAEPLNAVGRLPPGRGCL